MEFRSQRKLRHRKLKGRKFTFCDFTAFFAGDVLLWSAYEKCLPSMLDEFSISSVYSEGIIAEILNGSFIQRTYVTAPFCASSD